MYAAAARQWDFVALAVECLQERHEVLVVGKFLSDRERHDHHVNGGVAFGQSAEERRDWSVQLLHGALGGGRTVAVIPGVTHSCGTEKRKNLHASWRKGIKRTLQANVIPTEDYLTAIYILIALAMNNAVFVCIYLFILSNYLSSYCDIISYIFYI